MTADLHPAPRQHVAYFRLQVALLADRARYLAAHSRDLLGDEAEVGAATGEV